MGGILSHLLKNESAYLILLSQLYSWILLFAFSIRTSPWPVFGSRPTREESDLENASWSISVASQKSSVLLAVTKCIIGRSKNRIEKLIFFWCSELEEESPIINWSLELGTRLDSRLYALWNRTAGDCLLDSVLQATWGIYDKDSVLRKSLNDSLHDCSHW